MRLIARLQRIQEVFDFGHVILNENLAYLPVGKCFGELALLNPQDARLASISTTKRCLLCYIEKDDWTAGLNRIKHAKLTFLRTFRLFRDVSSTKLLTLRLRMNLISMVKGQRLYTEGEEADGVYLIRSGSVKYSKNVNTKLSVKGLTKNNWFYQ